MRLVIDTSIVVAAVRSKNGASNVILSEALAGRCSWLCSVPLFCEYEAVLTRAELLMEVGRKRPEMNGFLTDIALVLEPVELHFVWRPQLGDPDDEMLVETAANGRARYLVTHNIKDFQPIVGRFDFDIITPGDLLRRRRS